MFRTLRMPERLFSIGMWIVSLLFAWFLSGLGGKLVGELPGVDQSLTRAQFLDARAEARDSLVRDSLRTLQLEVQAVSERTELTRTAAQNAYSTARNDFQNWIATRTATTDPRQDPEVIRRNRQLDSLSAGVREAQQVADRIAQQLLAIQQEDGRLQARRAEREAAVESQYQAALFRKELGVFGIRLALTLPLLLLAGWFVARKRASDYWPLYRGFVLFGVFTFFVELVPYLPSYGGYVRYGVGIVATLVVARYVIIGMRRYLARRAEIERQTDAERRQALGYEEALKRMGANLCPGCERPIAGAPANPSTFCVHCGLGLFDQCAACGTRKNAFFQYCPSCGVRAAGDRPVTGGSFGHDGSPQPA